MKLSEARGFAGNMALGGGMRLNHVAKLIAFLVCLSWASSCWSQTAPDHQDIAAVPVEQQQAAKLSKIQLMDFAREAARKNNIPDDFFVRLIRQESGFDSKVISRAGAAGIAQFMPGTAAERGLKDPFDPTEALPKSAEFLRDLYAEFGNLGLAAAAYNAGPARIKAWLSGRSSLPFETQQYVKIITGESAELWAPASVRPFLRTSVAPNSFHLGSFRSSLQSLAPARNWELSLLPQDFRTLLIYSAGNKKALEVPAPRSSHASRRTRAAAFQRMANQNLCPTCINQKVY